MTFIKAVWGFFSGYKTYMVGAAMVVVGYHNSDMQMVMEGLGLLAMRGAIAKLE